MAVLESHNGYYLWKYVSSIATAGIIELYLHFPGVSTPHRANSVWHSQLDASVSQTLPFVDQLLTKDSRVC